ncbi:hypothetical protein M8C21_018655 [Ambrosia artemisiifolia]|uniref:RRM domain-containing protein n=1 Tax=Ambrosia artemisiifolia TaxID=4212 RepID=A0AAD5G9L9_AMBAR|nr:hypothetical protein M8C21_018655 [Ambrosia artemisiifolia]
MDLPSRLDGLRVRDMDMKHGFAFVEFCGPRDANDARYSLNGRDLNGSRLLVEFAKGVSGLNSCDVHVIRPSVVRFRSSDSGSLWRHQVVKIGEQKGRNEAY